MKFRIKSVNFHDSNHGDHFGYGRQPTLMYETSIELTSFDVYNAETLDLLREKAENDKDVNLIFETKEFIMFQQFQDEFREFLLEKHPDKVFKDLNSFNK